MIEFLKKYWLPLVLLGVIIWILMFQQANIEKYQEEIRTLETDNKWLVKRNELYLAKIDSLSKIDAEIIEVIKEIKGEEYEKIIAVDTMSISDLQDYFTKRYSN